jgi:CRISPR-associated protein Cas2
MLWMICYDISDDKTRRVVERLLLAEGERVQWSVFECFLTPTRHMALRARIRELIDPDDDSVRYYPLCAWCEERLAWQGQGRRTEDPDLWVV